MISLLSTSLLVSSCKDGGGSVATQAHLGINASSIALSPSTNFILTITNDGGIAVQGLNFTFNPAISGLSIGSSQSLTATNESGTSIPPGGKLVVKLKASQAASIGKHTTLEVTSSNAGNKLDVPVKIEASAFKLQLNADSNLIGSGETKQYTLKNTGGTEIVNPVVGVLPLYNVGYITAGTPKSLTFSQN